MKRLGLCDQNTGDALRIAGSFALIILASLVQLVAATLLIGIFVVGFLMIFDHDYLPLFDQWLVAVILYIVYRAATLPRRANPDPAFLLVMMAASPDLDASFEAGSAAGFGAPPRRLPSNAPSNADGRPRLTLIGHGR